MPRLGRKSILICPDCGKPDWKNHKCPRPKGKHGGLRAGGPQRVAQRELEMVMLFRGGCTMSEIGDAIGLTRERVRQILKLHGVTGKEHVGWAVHDTTKARAGIRLKNKAASEERHLESLLRCGWRERMVSRVVGELAEDLGRVPTALDIVRALGMTGLTPTSHGPRLWGYLDTSNTPSREAYSVIMSRVYSRAGLQKRGAGSPGHIVQPPPGRVLSLTCSHGHALYETGNGWRYCPTCNAAARRRAKAKAEGLVTVGRFEVAVA